VCWVIFSIIEIWCHLKLYERRLLLSVGLVGCSASAASCPPWWPLRNYTTGCSQLRVLVSFLLVPHLAEAGRDGLPLVQAGHQIIAGRRWIAHRLLRQMCCGAVSLLMRHGLMAKNGGFFQNLNLQFLNVNWKFEVVPNRYMTSTASLDCRVRLRNTT
jgi:hypothetical protein